KQQPTAEEIKEWYRRYYGWLAYYDHQQRLQYQAWEASQSNHPAERPAEVAYRPASRNRVEPRPQKVEESRHTLRQPQDVAYHASVSEEEPIRRKNTPRRKSPRRFRDVAVSTASARLTNRDSERHAPPRANDAVFSQPPIHPTDSGEGLLYSVT